jgi:hypothetical protein
MKNKITTIKKKFQYQQFLIKTKSLAYYQKTNKKLLISQTNYLF